MTLLYYLKPSFSMPPSGSPVKELKRKRVTKKERRKKEDEELIILLRALDDKNTN